jgi:hypothetical protein
MEQQRQIIYYKDYFLDFFDQQPEKVKEKINYVLFLVAVADRIPQKFFQHLEGTNGLYPKIVIRNFKLRFETSDSKVFK